jgi:hypothetical protein
VLIAAHLVGFLALISLELLSVSKNVLHPIISTGLSKIPVDVTAQLVVPLLLSITLMLVMKTAPLATIGLKEKLSVLITALMDGLPTSVVMELINVSSFVLVKTLFGHLNSKNVSLNALLDGKLKLMLLA